MKFLFVGPAAIPVTGQSYSFHYTYEKCLYSKKCFSFRIKGSVFTLLSSNFIAYSSYLIYLIYCFLSSEKCTVYIVTGRTKLGFVRDFFYIHAAKFFRFNIVNHLHGADFNFFRSNVPSFMKVLLDFTYNKIDKSIVLVEPMLEQYDMYQDMEIEVIPNFYTENINSSDSLNLNEPNRSRLNITYMSNIMSSKGIFYLLDAVDEMVKNGLDIHLNIAGAPVPDNEMSYDDVKHNFLSRIDNSDYISYLGVVKGQEKVSLLKNTNVFVLPSHYPTEAQPITIIEALAAGCYIVSTHHNYLPGMLEPTISSLVPIRSSNAIYDVIAKVNSERYLLREAAIHNSKIAEEHYSSENYIKSINRVFKGFI